MFIGYPSDPGRSDASPHRRRRIGPGTVRRKSSPPFTNTLYLRTMGEAELLFTKHQLIIHSHFIIYGNAATEALTEMIRDEVETMWNQPRAIISIDDKQWQVGFHITAAFKPELTALEIYQNLDPRNNYFRIEEFSHLYISFVDKINCNTGYFKLENLYKGSTTAAHEYGHTLGLIHPGNIDHRGKGVPGIMYPRGSLVDPQYQYNPSAEAGDNQNGGTMAPYYRQVLAEDIYNLQLHTLSFEQGKCHIGEFTSIWHPDHQAITPEEYEQLCREQPANPNDREENIA